MKLVRHELAGKFRISREYIKWKSQAATMTPADFLKKALPFGKGGAHGPAVEKYRKAIRSGEKIDAPQLFVNRARGGGFNHPANFKVTGHEGRHRMVAAQQEGITKVPVEIVAYQEPRFPDRSPALRKAMKMPRHFKPENKESRFARIDRGRLEMSSRRQEPLPIGYEAGIPLTGRVPRDRWVKKIRDEDLDRRDANLLRAGVAGAVGGALLRKSYRPGKLIPSGAKVGPARAYLRAMPTGSAAGFGAAAGIAGVLGIRQLTKHRRDPYGERQRGDKKAESVPALAGIGAAGYGAYRILRKKFKMSDGRFEFAEKKKKEINPYLTAGLSGAASGAGLGGLALLRRGVGLGGALKTGALGALFTGGVVGGGSIVGSKIVGEPKPKERAPFAIRSAVGGAIVGTAAGAAGGLLMRRVPKINRKIAGLANEWRPANWLTKSGSLKATGVGAVAGGGYGAFTGADEGQQVDTIRNLRKDIRKMSATSRTIELAGCCNSCMKQRIQRSTEFIKSKLKNKVKMQSTSETIELEKPFHGYNKKRHAKTGGLNDSYRKQYNRENGSNLKRPVTTEPSKLKPGSKSAKRRASFCARMGGMPGPTSKDGKLTPKGAALKRWNCSTEQKLVEFGIAGRALQKSLFIGKAKPPIRLPYPKGEIINPLVDNVKHPTKQAMLVDMRKRQPSWNRGIKNKLRNFVEDYLMSDKSQPLEFQLTEEQRQLRNAALIAGGVAVPVGTAAYLGIRSIKKANAANEAMYKTAVAGGARPADVLGKYVTGKDRKVARGTPLALPPSEFAKQSLRKRGLGENGPAISKVDRYRRIAAERATLTSRRGQISLPLGSKLRGELIMRKSADRGRMRAGRQLRTDRSSALRPIIKDSLPEGRKSVPVGSSKVTLKSGAVGQVEHAPLMSSERMISTGKNLQEGIRNPALHSRGERKNMIAALALLRRKFKFASNQPTHAFDIWVRNERTGRASGFKDYVRGEDLVDREGRAATVTLPTFISSARREAEKGFRTARRTARLGKDVTEVVQGRKTKKREWEKGYFQKAVAVAALTGGLAAHGLVMRRALRPNAPKWVSGYSDSVKGATKYVVDQKNKMRDSVTKSVGLMSARLNHTIVLFEDKPKSTWKKAAGVAAGLGTAALGASMLPAAYKMAKIQIRHGGNVAKRKVFKSPKSDPYNGGRFVSDYLDASQAALNSGIHGKVIGKVLQTAKQKPGGMTAAVLRKTGVAGDDFKVSHYARFRAGQKEALGHWDWEVGQRVKSKSGHARMAKRRDAAQKEIQDRLYNYGQNEKEAIRHVATSTRNKDVRDYFDQLAAHKKGAAKMYARRLALAPVAVVGGAGVAAASSRKEFSYYDADMEGWDLRDARGRSARVFAPNSKRRVRRESKWHERKRNQRNLLIGGGLVAAIGTGAGALAIGGAGRAKAVSAVKNRMMGMINRVRRNRSIRPKPSKEWQPTLLPAATA